MKKTNLFLAALCFIAFSCKKEAAQTKLESGNDSTAVPISFNLNGFELQSTGSSTNSLTVTNALKDQIKYLHYAVYRGSPADEKYAYQVRKQIVQSSGDANFGSIKDTLYNKRYGIYFVGSQTLGALGPGEIHGSGGSYVTHPIYSPLTPMLSKELYYAAVDTTFSATFAKSVVLKRMVSLVTFQINDIMPANADKVVVSYGDYPPGFDLATGTGKPRVREDSYPDADFTYQVNPSDLGKANFSVSTVIWPYRYYDVRISCYDKSGKLIATKVIPPNEYDFYLTIERNTHYTYRGSLFIQNGQFDVSIDDRWNAPIVAPFSVNYVKHTTN